MAKQADISKQVWKFQEGLTYLALCEICSNPNEVHWNYEKGHGTTKKKYTPVSMSIDPDIVIGSDTNAPETLVFVTHATMERGSEKKFWRTVAEVIEEKAISSHPRVLSVLYCGNVKANLMVAYEYLFDGVIHLDNEAWGKDLSDNLMELAKLYGASDPSDVLPILKSYIKEHDEHWQGFLKCTEEMYSAGYGDKHQTLVSIAMNKTSRIPAAHSTAFRRGVYKIVTLPQQLREDIVNEKNTLVNVPYHAIALRWFSPIATTKPNGKYRLIDEDIKCLINDFSKETVYFLVDKAQTLDSFMQYIDNLRNVSVRSVCNEWIVEHYDELCTDVGMKKRFNDVFENAYRPLENRVTEEECPSTHWLFEGIMTMLRVETGRNDGYGYSTLGIEAGHEYEIGGIGGVVISPYIKREKSISDELVTDISKVFANHFVRLGLEGVKYLLGKSVAQYCHSILTYTIGTYRLFNPIDWLVMKKLDECSIPYQSPVAHDSFLSDEVSGITTSTGNMICINNGKCWIKCQSSFDGKTDKRKELCGRVGAMKLKYTADTIADKAFYLVLDGYFDQEDLSLLDKAGWDGIFYYNEVDELLKNLK